MSAAVLSEHFWRTHFHAELNIVGTSILLNSRAFQVVGVTPGQATAARWVDREKSTWSQILPDPGARGTSDVHPLRQLASEAVNGFCLPRLRLGRRGRRFRVRVMLLKSGQSKNLMTVRKRSGIGEES
jgi:hypothetical protein